ncbi:hypothetical protein FQR65_LT20916 [Abscondita terminalis]|nr:hypothetical protein FQR65_LT20916 [Abscondita terminalis]
MVPRSPLNQPHVQPGRVVEPDDQRPGFLGVPLPVGAPGVGRPQRTQDRGHGEERETIADCADIMMSSSTSSDGSAAAMRRRPSRIAPTTTAPMPKYSIQVADRPSLRKTMVGAQQHTQPKTPPNLSQGPWCWPCLLDQVGEAHLAASENGAVADEVGRHVQLHPPALERGHQGLDLPASARERIIPERNTTAEVTHQHHEAAQRLRLAVLAFVVQVDRAVSAARTARTLRTGADGDGAQVRPHQLWPSRQGTSMPVVPAKTAPQLSAVPSQAVAWAEETDPVARPWPARTARSSTEWPIATRTGISGRNLLGARQVVAVRASSARRPQMAQATISSAQRTPQPALQASTGTVPHRMIFRKLVHGGAMAHQGIARANRQQQEEHQVGPVRPAAAGPAVAGFGKRILPQRFGRGGMRGAGRRGHEKPSGPFLAQQRLFEPLELLDPDAGDPEYRTSRKTPKHQQQAAPGDRLRLPGVRLTWNTLGLHGACEVRKATGKTGG